MDKKYGDNIFVDISIKYVILLENPSRRVKK